MTASSTEEISARSIEEEEMIKNLVKEIDQLNEHIQNLNKYMDKFEV